MDELLKYLVTSLVENKDSVEVNKSEDDKSVTFNVKVAGSDIGKVIGKNGKTAASIRTIMRTMAAKTHKKVFVKFED